MYSYGPPHMAKQKQDDRLELTYSSYVKTQDVTLKTCRRRCKIGRSCERWSGISMLVARHEDDDDDDDFHYIKLLVLKMSFSTNRNQNSRLNLHDCDDRFLLNIYLKMINFGLNSSVGWFYSLSSFEYYLRQILFIYLCINIWFVNVYFEDNIFKQTHS